jgi:hypothetical protein
VQLTVLATDTPAQIATALVAAIAKKLTSRLQLLLNRMQPIR